MPPQSSPDSTYTPRSPTNFTGQPALPDPEPVSNTQPTPATSQQVYGTAHEQENENDPPPIHSLALESPAELPTPDIPDMSAFQQQQFTFRPGPGFLADSQTSPPFPSSTQPTPDPSTLPHSMTFPRAATPSALFDNPPLPQCPCYVVPRCVCRLQAGNDELEAENNTLRDALRAVRLELAAHGRALQEIEGTGLMGGEAMMRLWGGRDRMRKLLASYG